eukprot:9035044-Ditylum_brightwellii.AAC.1
MQQELLLDLKLMTGNNTALKQMHRKDPTEEIRQLSILTTPDGNVSAELIQRVKYSVALTSRVCKFFVSQKDAL